MPGAPIIPRIVKAKIHIDQHFSDRITLTEIAEEASFSKYHFTRMFKSTYGIGVIEYINNKRLQRAKELLEKGYSVSETCYEIGYLDTSSFSRFFKKAGGVSPKNYGKNSRLRLRKITRNPQSIIPHCFAEKM